MERNRLLAREGLCFLVLALASCGLPGSGEETARVVDVADPGKAQDLNSQAVLFLSVDQAAAERLLLQALACDPWFGPAHNNLGVLYLERNNLARAADEFKRARGLLPGHPDPRLNLGLTLERAGRTSEALKAYAEVHEANLKHLQASQALVRLQIRLGKTDARTLALLREVALCGEDQAWRAWARRELAKRDASADEGAK